MKVIAVIPARLASTRLPRKMLREVAGQPLLAHVYRAVRSSELLDDVVIATDSEEILEFCKKNSWHVRMTSADHRSGTERVCEIARSMAADVYLNVQGDEPLTRPEHINSVLGVMTDVAVQVGTANFYDPKAPLNVLTGLERFLKRKGLSSVRDLVGQMKQ